MAEAQQPKNLIGYCQEAHKLFPTNCSGAVRHIAKQMGYPLPELQANKLIGYIEEAGWVEVDEHRAQTFADHNRLVIAGKKDDPNGHVVVVLPGGMAKSGGYSYVNKKSGKTMTAPDLGEYPRSCSTTMGNWPGADSKGEKSVFDSWGKKEKYEGVKYWVAPLPSGL